MSRAISDRMIGDRLKVISDYSAYFYSQISEHYNKNFLHKNIISLSWFSNSCWDEKEYKFCDTKPNCAKQYIPRCTHETESNHTLVKRYFPFHKRVYTRIYAARVKVRMTPFEKKTSVSTCLRRDR